MMIVNMYSVVEKGSSDISLIVSFKLKGKAETHANFLNENAGGNFTVVPSEINLCEPIN